MARNPGRHAGLAIRLLVADQEARCAVDRPAIEQILYHPGCRFAPVADTAICGNHGFGVKGTVANIVEVRTTFGEFGGDLSMEIQDIAFGIKTPGYSRLVGYHKDKESGIVERFDCRLAAIDPAETLARPDVPIVVIEDPVAIEKGGGSPSPLSHLLLSK